jgi:branched-chain amino acid transport system permease protein
MASTAIFSSSASTAHRLRAAGIPLLVAALALLAFLPLPDFWITQLNYIGMYSLPVLGLVLLTGVWGLTSFGQAAFVGIGAYTSAYLTVSLGLSPWLTLFVGWPSQPSRCAGRAAITLRMSGHYLPLATMAWGLSLYYLMGNLECAGQVRRHPGRAGADRVRAGTWARARLFYVLVWGVALLACRGVVQPAGFAHRPRHPALAGGSQMAEAMGVNTLRYKVGVFVMAAMLASISGWLFAHFQRTVNPSPFGLKMGIEYMFMAVLGGAGHVWGASRRRLHHQECWKTNCRCCCPN